MRTLSGKTRYAFLLFFLTHIPITMMIDAQAFIPQRFFASPIRELFKWYCFRFKDSLMTAPHDVWIQAVIACECFLQIPFFFLRSICTLVSRQNWRERKFSLSLSNLRFSHCNHISSHFGMYIARPSNNISREGSASLVLFSFRRQTLEFFFLLYNRFIC